MVKVASNLLEEHREHLAAVAAAHEEANRTALLEHARMGRSVPEGDHDGNVVWITPVEIFARYGLDEFGRPKS